MLNSLLQNKTKQKWKKCSWKKILRLNSAYRFHAKILQHKREKNSRTYYKWISNRSIHTIVRWGKCLLFFSHSLFAFRNLRWSNECIWLKNITFLWSMLIRLAIAAITVVVLWCDHFFYHVANCCLREKMIQCSTVCKHVRCGLFLIWGGINKTIQEKSTAKFIFIVLSIQMSRFYNGVICFTLILVQSIGSWLM